MVLGAIHCRQTVPCNTRPVGPINIVLIAAATQPSVAPTATGLLNVYACNISHLTASAARGFFIPVAPKPSSIPPHPFLSKIFTSLPFSHPLLCISHLFRSLFRANLDIPLAYASIIADHRIALEPIESQKARGRAAHSGLQWSSPFSCQVRRGGSKPMLSRARAQFRSRRRLACVVG